KVPEYFVSHLKQLYKYPDALQIIHDYLVPYKPDTTLKEPDDKIIKGKLFVDLCIHATNLTIMECHEHETKKLLSSMKMDKGLRLIVKEKMLIINETFLELFVEDYNKLSGVEHYKQLQKNNILQANRILAVFIEETLRMSFNSMEKDPFTSLV